MEWWKKKERTKIVSDLMKSGQNELADAFFVTINAQHLHWHNINIILIPTTEWHELKCIHKLR